MRPCRRYLRPRNESRTTNVMHYTDRRKWLKAIRKNVDRLYCEYCGVPVSINPRKHTSEYYATVDHKVPLSRGGKDRQTNWAVACAGCNSKKADMTDVEYRQWFAMDRAEREMKKAIKRAAYEQAAAANKQGGSREQSE